MARAKKLLLPRQKRALTSVGENLRLARLRRELSASQVAERAGITLPTLYRLEKGSGSSSIATLLLVMAALGLEGDFLLLGRDDVLGRKLEDAKLTRKRQRAPKKDTSQAKRKKS